MTLITLLKHSSIVLLIALVAGCASKKSENGPTDAIDIVNDGIRYRSYTSLAPKAAERAQYIVQKMLENSAEIKQSFINQKFVIEIIGRKQKLSDIPRYAHLKDKKTFDGRSFDDGTRGVGEAQACSVGEENLLCLADQIYWEENILVHEFAHSVKFLMPVELSNKIDTAFANAKKNNLYPLNIYMMADSQEYWAESTQAWFHATVRKDVNAGINTRAGIKAHDPEMAAILLQVYGEVEISPLKNCRY